MKNIEQFQKYAPETIAPQFETMSNLFPWKPKILITLYLKNPLVAKGIAPEPVGYICKVWKKNTEQFPRHIQETTPNPSVIK